MSPVVVADKNEEVRKVTVSLLSDLNFDVTEVTETDQLLQRLDEIHPSLLLVDLDMVSELGLELLKALRTRVPVMNVLMLLASGCSFPNIAEFLEIRGTDFLTKPFDAPQLLHRMRMLEALQPTIGLGSQPAFPAPQTDVLPLALHEPTTGRIDAKRTAAFLGVSLKSLATGLDTNYRAVHKTPSSTPLQPKLQPIRRILEILMQLLGTKEATLAWLNTPSPDLAERTPIELIRSAHADSVLALVENAMAGAPS